MSHFPTLVIGENPEELLAPFDENIEVEPYRSYEKGSAEDHWWTRAVRGDLDGFRRVETDGEAVVRDALVADFAARAQKWDRDTPEQKADRELADYRWVGERAKFIEEQPMSWPTFVDLHNERWHSGEEKDDDERLYIDEDGAAYTISTYNPKSKWDWYQLGGRWTGYFKLRDGAEGEAGDPGLMTASAKPGWVDRARKGAIDFEGMRAQAEAEAISDHAQVRAVLEGIALPLRWDHVREQMFPGAIEAAREFYWKQPGIEALRVAGIHADDPVEYFCLDADDPTAAYISRCVRNIDLPFAIVTADGWVERGHMGWWAIVTDESADWPTTARQIIDAAPDSALFSLYDLHI